MNKIPFKLEHGFRIFDFKECIQYLHFQGKNQFGNHFKIVGEDHLIIYKLLIYAIRDEEGCKKQGLDLRKGILLIGPIGCGKTSLMTLIQPFFYPQFNYSMITTREISLEFIKEGHPVLSKYGKLNHRFCFDDLGIENSYKHYGNECNVMAEILLFRYENYINKKCITHATTNLNAIELEQFYGNRVRSRLREMFNLIAFEKKVEDKRI